MTLTIALALAACGSGAPQEPAPANPPIAAKAPAAAVTPRKVAGPSPKAMTPEQIRTQPAPTSAEAKSIKDVMAGIAALPDAERQGVFALVTCRIRMSSDRDPFAKSQGMVAQASADLARDPKAAEKCSADAAGSKSRG